MTTWNELTPGQRQAIVTVGAVTTLWQVVMLVDLWRRPAERIRGSKRLWVLASFVRPVGQLAYYTWGRRDALDDGEPDGAVPPLAPGTAGDQRSGAAADQPVRGGAAFAPVEDRSETGSR